MVALSDNAMEVDRGTVTSEPGSSSSNVGVQAQPSHTTHSHSVTSLSPLGSTSSKIKATRLSHPLTRVPVNGYTVSKLDKPKPKHPQHQNIANVNGHVSTNGDHKSPSVNGLKRKMVFLEEEEDEDQGMKVQANGFVGNKSLADANHRPARFGSTPSNKKYAELQKQRKALPIAKGRTLFFH